MEFRLWDTIGDDRFTQDIFYCINQSHAVIAVFDLSLINTYNNFDLELTLKNQLRFIHKLDKYLLKQGKHDVPLMLVANKLDLYKVIVRACSFPFANNHTGTKTRQLYIISLFQSFVFVFVKQNRV